MSMRVVAGSQKGRSLKQPIGLSLRPTSGRVKEALFSMIADRLPNARVLDLYAGTGALGLEALSRGAQEVIFVENQNSSLHILRENISRCGSTQDSTIIAQDVLTFLSTETLRRDPTPFNLIFADPPYETADFLPLLTQLETSRRVDRDGLIIIEHFKKASLPQEAGDLRQVRQSRYGDTMLTFFRMVETSKDILCA